MRLTNSPQISLWAVTYGWKFSYTAAATVMADMKLNKIWVEGWCGGCMNEAGVVFREACHLQKTDLTRLLMGTRCIVGDVGVGFWQERRMRGVKRTISLVLFKKREFDDVIQVQFSFGLSQLALGERRATPWTSHKFDGGLFETNQKSFLTALGVTLYHSVSDRHIKRLNYHRHKC